MEGVEGTKAGMSTSVQDIFLSSVEGIRTGSRIPVRRDSSLPSSGRSTPTQRMTRERSSPPGGLMTGKPRLAPKPKIAASKTAGGQLATPATKPTAQAETPSGGGSKIPRPDRLTKKWESTSKLEMVRTSSDLNDVSLRKRALTQTLSGTFSRTRSESTSNLSRAGRSDSTSSLNRLGSASNLSRVGSVTSLRSAPFTSGGRSSSSSGPSLARSSSTSSFSTQDLNKSRQSKAEEEKSGRRLSSKSSGRGKDEEIVRLNRELSTSLQLIEGLRGEVEQKENIAKMAVDSNTVRGEDFEHLYRKLEKEHSEITTKSAEMQGKVGKLEAELKEARDTSDLLEFRLLEIEQRESRERTPEVGRKGEKYQSSQSSHTGDSGNSSQTTLDDLLEVQADFRNEKISDTKVKLHQLMEHIPEPGGKSLLLQTVALFETLLAKINILKEEGEVLAGEGERVKQEKAELTRRLEDGQRQRQQLEDRAREAESELIQTCEELEETKMKLVTSDKFLNQNQLETNKLETVNKQVQERQDKIASDLRKENENLQTLLATERQGHKAEKQMYQDVLEKYHAQERLLKEQEARLSTLSRRVSLDSAEFNPSKDMSMSDTKTTGSSSGVSSDLSDSESSELEPDQTHHHRHHQRQPSSLNLTQEFIPEEEFTESGIFEDVSSPDTSIARDMEVVFLKQELRDLQTQMAEKTAAYESELGTATAVEEENKKKKLDEYGSCEELEQIHASRMAESQREELTRLSQRLKDMEEKWANLYAQHQQVVEERCELEEAENDSRLRAQTLEIQYAGALERSQIIKDELIHERQSSEELRSQMDEMIAREENNQEDMESLQMHIQEQEQLIRELEDREVMLAEQLRLLDMGVKISNWWRAWSWIVQPEHQEGGEEEEEREEGVIRAALTFASAGEEGHEQPQDIKDEGREMKRVIKHQQGLMDQLETQFNMREKTLCAELERIEDEFESFLDQLLNILFGHVKLNNKREEVVDRVRGLVEAEASLRKQISDLEKKEAVYSKTIQDADCIMARVEYNYQEQIKLLHQEKHELKESLWNLEKKSKDANYLSTISELTDQLAAVERSEVELKARVNTLEKCQASLREELAREEQNNLQIKSEAKEAEGLVEVVERMKEEKDRLNLEVLRLREVENILVQLRKSEEELKARLKMLELEREETTLKQLEDTSAIRRESFNSVKKVVHDVAMDVHSDDSSCSLSGEGVVYTKHNLEVKTSNPSSEGLVEGRRRNVMRIQTGETSTFTTTSSTNTDHQTDSKKANTLRLEIKSLGSPQERRAVSEGRKLDSYGRKAGKEQQQTSEGRKQGDGSESRTSDLEYSEKYSRSEALVFDSRGNSTDREVSLEPESAKDSKYSGRDSGHPPTTITTTANRRTGDYRSEVSTGKFSNFYRYKSMRDHTGRFFLLVKIR